MKKRGNRGFAVTLNGRDGRIGGGVYDARKRKHRKNPCRLNRKVLAHPKSQKPFPEKNKKQRGEPTDKKNIDGTFKMKFPVNDIAAVRALVKTVRRK